MIRSQNVYNEGFERSGLVSLISEHAEQLQNVELESGDVLLNITGDSVARVCQVPNDILPARVNQHVAIIRPDPTKLHARFLRFFLVSPAMQARLLALASAGATRNALTKGMIESLSVPSLSLKDQQGIAELLGAMEDKLDLNRRTNETLAAMARALFKDWFVDFGPTRAKMQGIAPYLKVGLWDLFPSSLDNDGKPVGWRTVTLADLTERITKGTTPTQEDIYAARNQTSEVNYLRVNAIATDGSIIWNKLEKIPESIHFNVLRRSVLREGDVLYTIAGTIGRMTIVDHDLLPANTNQAVAIIRADLKRVPARFLYLAMNAEWFQEKLHTNIVHAVQANLSLSTISKTTITLPPFEKLILLFQTADHLFDAIDNNSKQARSLTHLRDLLLPRLMSGQVHLRGAEKQIEEAL